MAAKYRKVDTRMWDDEKFVLLTPMEKLVAIHAFTSFSNRCGIFKLSAGAAAEQCGMDSDSYAIAIERVCHTLGWRYDKGLRVLYLPTWWKYNPPENPKHLKGCLGDLHELPKTELLDEFRNNTAYLPKHSLETFQIAMGVGMAYQKQKQEQEQKHTQVRADEPMAEPQAEPSPEPTAPAEPSMADAIEAAFTGADEPAARDANAPAAVLARNKADAAGFAKGWLTMNRPDLMFRFRSFAELIEFEGENRGWEGANQRALDAAESALLNASVSDPFAYTLAQLRGKASDSPRRRSGRAQPRMKPATQRPSLVIHGEV